MPSTLHLPVTEQVREHLDAIKEHFAGQGIEVNNPTAVIYALAHTELCIRTLHSEPNPESPVVT